MANEIYNSIAAKIRDLIKADAEFVDVTNYYLYTKTLEAAIFPCCFVAKTERDTRAEELDEQLTENTLTYQVEVYYKDDHGREIELNKKDHALKALIKANPSLGGYAQDAQCYSSRISSEYLGSDLLTLLSAKIVVFLDE